MARDRCSALVLEAEAEAKMSNKMEGLRRHDEKMGAANVLIQTGERKNKVVISGKEG